MDRGDFRGKECRKERNTPQIPKSLSLRDGAWVDVDAPVMAQVGEDRFLLGLLYHGKDASEFSLPVLRARDVASLLRCQRCKERGRPSFWPLDPPESADR